MKRVAILIFVLSAWANATVFTATQSGDWNTATTWGGVTGTVCGTNIPCMTSTLLGGDQVIIPSTYVITCTGASEVCSAGTSPANQTTLAISVTGTGGITVGGTATLIYAGPVKVNDGSTITVDAGGTIQYDSSWAAAPTTAAYQWLMSSADTTGAIFSMVGTSGAHITWQGDSSFSSLADSGVCALNACRSGPVGDDVQGFNDSGRGTFAYVDWKNVGQIGAKYSYLLDITAESSTITSSTFTNCGTVGVTIEGNGSGGVTFNGNSFLSCASTNTSWGCFKLLTSGGTITGTKLIENNIFDGAVSIGTGTNGGWTWRDNLFWTSLTNGTPGLNPGFFSGSDASNYDQEFFDNTSVWTGTSENANATTILPAVTLTNSVAWVAVGNSGAGFHQVFFHTSFASEAGSGTMASTNNVFGAMGFDTSVSGDYTYAQAVGGTPTSAVSTTLTSSGNVNLCGYNGVGTLTLANMFLDNGNIADMTLIENNNTSCVYNASLSSDVNPSGSAGVEGGTVTAGAVSTVNSNLFFRNDSGGPIAELCDSTFSACSTTKPFALFENNAVVNTNTAASPVCSDVSNCITTGPQNDVTIQSRPPVLVEAGRSLPLFDEYLTPAGLLLTSSYGATAWATSTSYSVGNYVYDSQSGVFGGKTTYWRCIQAHTSGSTNRPVTGFDSSNPFYGQAGYWEPAFMPWLRSAVLAGTTYTDGALNVNGVYVIGLLNAWLRQGMTSMEPTLWQGCLNGAECGAVQLTAIQHIPPPAMVN